LFVYRDKHAVLYNELLLQFSQYIRQVNMMHCQ